MKCSYCSKEFTGSKYQERQLKNNKNVFCSKTCGNLFRYKDNYEEISEEELVKKIKDLFFNTELPYDTIKKMSGVSQSKFTDIVKRYNIKRTSSDINKLKIDHMQKTIKQKYDVDNIMELQTYRNKIKESHANRSKKEKQITIKQIANTKKLLYGSETYNNRQQAKETNFKQYGVASPVERLDIIEKRKQASLEKYGVENPFNSKEVQLKADKVLRDKYGDKKAFGNIDVRKKVEATNKRRYGHKNAFSNKEIQEKQFNTIREKYGVQYACQLEQCAQTSPKANSKPNKEYINLLQPDRTEIPINIFRYDMLKGNILIEINPTYTHNTFFNPYGKPKDRLYHYNKTIIALENNYECIHVWDWDNKDKIKQLVSDKETLYARNLIVKEVSLDISADFLNMYHIQDNCKGQSIRLGLYKDEELIEIMTFGKPRYNKNYEWELIRLCTHKDYKVVGGAEKLFKEFLKRYEPNSIISYCDFSKFTGKVYERLGFKQEGNAKPSKHWSKGTQHITDNLLRQRGYDQLFGTNYGKGTSNEELMLENGWLPIYDCGQLTFTWKKE